jgi:cell shape-determining protein MreD
MTPTRVVAALAAVLTALLAQATLVAPVASPVPVSLPAVLVAAVALVEGPGSGLALGFATGLVADFGSSHPAGVLALCWAGVGLVCAMSSDGRSVRHDAAVAAGVCAVFGSVATLLLTVLHSGGATAWIAARDVVPTGIGDALLALAVVPAVRAFLRTDALRAPRRVPVGLGPGGRHG